MQIGPPKETDHPKTGIVVCNNGCKIGKLRIASAEKMEHLEIVHLAGQYHSTLLDCKQGSVETFCQQQGERNSQVSSKSNLAALPDQ